MSIKRTIMRMPNFVDIYEKTVVENDAGQLKASWIISHDRIRCFVTPSGSAASVRVSPTAEEMDYLTVIMPYDAPITYTSRLSNFTNIYGDDIYSGTFEVIQMDKHMSPMTGRVEYLQLKLKSVAE